MTARALYITWDADASLSPPAANAANTPTDNDTPAESNHTHNVLSYGPQFLHSGQFIEQDPLDEGINTGTAPCLLSPLRSL